MHTGKGVVPKKAESAHNAVNRTHEVPLDARPGVAFPPLWALPERLRIHLVLSKVIEHPGLCEKGSIIHMVLAL